MVKSVIASLIKQKGTGNTLFLLIVCLSAYTLARDYMDTSDLISHRQLNLIPIYPQ